jgi:hypothetical protein
VSDDEPDGPHLLLLLLFFQICPPNSLLSGSGGFGGGPLCIQSEVLFHGPGGGSERFADAIEFCKIVNRTVEIVPLASSYLVLRETDFLVRYLNKIKNKIDNGIEKQQKLRS